MVILARTSMSAQTVWRIAMAALCPVCNKNSGKFKRDDRLLCFDCNKLEIDSGPLRDNLLPQEAIELLRRLKSATIKDPNLQAQGAMAAAQMKATARSSFTKSSHGALSFLEQQNMKNQGVTALSNPICAVTSQRVLLGGTMAGSNKFSLSSVAYPDLQDVSIGAAQLKLTLRDSRIFECVFGSAELASESRDRIVEHLQLARTSASSAPTAPLPVSDVASQLEKLAGLLEKGLLTPEEFSAQKQKLLGL